MAFWRIWHFICMLPQVTEGLQAPVLPCHASGTGLYLCYWFSERTLAPDCFAGQAVPNCLSVPTWPSHGFPMLAWTSTPQLTQPEAVRRETPMGSADELRTSSLERRRAWSRTIGGLRYPARERISGPLLVPHHARTAYTQQCIHHAIFTDADLLQVGKTSRGARLPAFSTTTGTRRIQRLRDGRGGTTSGAPL